MELVSSEHKILIINVYFPYYNSRDLENYLTMYRDTIGFIDNVMHQNTGHEFLLLGDFNCNIFDVNHVYSKLVQQLMEKYQLFSTFDLSPDFDARNDYTRYDTKTRSFTLIDGIMTSQGLRSCINNVRIGHYGDNVSDHLPVEIDLFVTLEEVDIGRPIIAPYVNWNKLTQEQRLLFKQKMSEYLNNISVPLSCVVHGNHLCFNDCHKASVERYYEEITTAILKAEQCLPRVNPSIQRSFWSEELSVLKDESINSTNEWKEAGCPSSGPIYDLKKDCHYRYKKEIRKCKREDEKRQNDALFDDLMGRDTNAFWKKWNSINRIGDPLVTRIEGETDPVNIADTFSRYFESVYGGHDTPEHLAMKNDFHDTFENYFITHVNDDISSFYLSWEEMIDVARHIKLGKATGGAIRPEHFIFGCPELFCHFQYLFNGIIQHGFVPIDFLNGTISPIVKNAQGNLSSCNNYRGITLGCLPAKLFEYALQLKLSHILGTDPLQFGFKKKTGTTHALYTLKSTVDYFVRNGSKVFVAFLDCTKAFDRISHYGLFSKLITRGIPLCFLLCLMFWYENMVSSVKWGSAKGREFGVPLGIKQGGINSPDFFSVYFDDLTKLLRKQGIGCFIGFTFLASIFYADDICLLAPTRSALQKMINTCADYCKDFGLSFNSTKSKVMMFSKMSVNYDLVEPIYINGTAIEYVEKIKYLGTTIMSKSGFSFSAAPKLQSFFRSVNSILNVINKPDEVTQMHLLFSNCVPVLSHASAVKEFSARDMHTCNTAVNDAVRKIFSFQQWESVRELRSCLATNHLPNFFPLRSVDLKPHYLPTETPFFRSYIRSTLIIYAINLILNSFFLTLILFITCCDFV